MILPQQLVQVLPQQLERNANVIAKKEVIDHVYDVARIVGIAPAHVLQQLNLDEALPMELLAIAQHLQGDLGVTLVIVRAHHLAKRALPQLVEDLVAIGDVVVAPQQVQAVVVVVAAVARLALLRADLVGARTDKIHVIEALDFAMFVRRQATLVLDECGCITCVFFFQARTGICF